MRKAIFALLAVALSCSPGCLARQVAKDGINLRHAILDMYTDQVMDNLIRARSNMPFVQLKYSLIQANDSDEYSASPAIDETVAITRDLVTGAAMRTITGDYKVGAMGDRKRTMNFTADPVTDENDIYLRYLEFANDPSLLVVSQTPPCGPVHIARQVRDMHYWVPIEAAPDFLELALKTTFMRGKDDGDVIPSAVDIVIADVENPEVVPGRKIVNATLLFDKAIPNGPATLLVDLKDGREVRIHLWRVYKDRDDNRLDLGQPTTRLDAQWSPEKDGFTAIQLKGRPARFYSHDFPPEANVPSPVLRQINTNLNSIRVQTQQQHAGS